MKWWSCCWQRKKKETKSRIKPTCHFTWISISQNQRGWKWPLEIVQPNHLAQNRGNQNKFLRMMSVVTAQSKAIPTAQDGIWGRAQLKSHTQPAWARELWSPAKLTSHSITIKEPQVMGTVSCFSWSSFGVIPWNQKGKCTGKAPGGHCCTSHCSYRGWRSRGYTWTQHWDPRALQRQAQSVCRELDCKINTSHAHTNISPQALAQMHVLQVHCTTPWDSQGSERL